MPELQCDTLIPSLPHSLYLYPPLIVKQSAISKEVLYPLQTRWKLILFFNNFCGNIMAVKLDDNPLLGAHVMSNLCYLICLRQLIRSEISYKSDFFFSPPRKDIFSFIRARHVLSYRLT